jgi:hypothetical protein
MVMWPFWFITGKWVGGGRVAAANTIKWICAVGKMSLSPSKRKMWKEQLAKSLGVSKEEQKRLVNARDVYECAIHFPVASVHLTASGCYKLYALAMHCPDGVRPVCPLSLSLSSTSPPPQHIGNSVALKDANEDAVASDIQAETPEDVVAQGKSMKEGLMVKVLALLWFVGVFLKLMRFFSAYLSGHPSKTNT